MQRVDLSSFLFNFAFIKIGIKITSGVVTKTQVVVHM